MLVKLRILFYKAAYKFYRIYLKAFDLRLRGAVCLIEWQGKILLIRKNYGDLKWNLPGGGIGRNETPERAAVREVREEVGIRLSGVSEIGSFTGTCYYRKDTLFIFYSAVENPEFQVDGVEIREAEWFEWTALPENLSDDVKRVIQIHRSSREK